MSARLNMNPIPIVKWKGDTFNQVNSFIKFNSITDNYSLRSSFKAGPLKIFRREIASTPLLVCNPRSSLTLDNFNRPGSSIINSSATTTYGLVKTTYIHLPNNSCEVPGTCSVVLSPAENARKRVRSGGMIRRQFDLSKNNDTYYTSSGQYLSSRNRSFKQNQYNYIRMGDSNAKPGSSLSSANVYSPQGLSHCPKYHISTQTKFTYRWEDENVLHDVIIPVGYYTVDDLNTVLKQTMFANKHYLLKEGNLSSGEYYGGNISYFLNISFNNISNKVELQSSRLDFNSVKNNQPLNPGWLIPALGADIFPEFVLSEQPVLDALGFSTATTFPLVSRGVELTTTAIILTTESTSVPGIQKLYVKLYYKPSNYQFAQQGAVSAGDLITRKKYNSITNSTVAYRSAFGDSVANALAYGVPSNGYTYKDKLGYPLKKTPTFSKYSDEMKQCGVTSFANAI
jgi:hypothetical protein